MAKVFEEPIITDCFDAVEGVFAGSGVVPPPTPPTENSNFNWSLSVDGNDGGSHSDIQIKGSNKGPDGNGWSCTIVLGDRSRFIKDVTQVGRGDVKCAYNESTIWLSSGMHYNPNESIGFTISVVFGTRGSSATGSLYEGGYTPSQAEQAADQKLTISGGI